MLHAWEEPLRLVLKGESPGTHLDAIDQALGSYRALGVPDKERVSASGNLTMTLMSREAFFARS